MTYLLKHFEAVAKTASFEGLSQVPTLLLEVTRAAAQLHQGPRSLVGGGGESGANSMYSGRKWEMDKWGQ